MKHAAHPLVAWGGYGLAAVFAALWLAPQDAPPAGQPAKGPPGAGQKVSGPLGPPAPDPKLRFDARTTDLLSDLETLQVELMPGAVNARFQEKAWETLLDNDAERRTRNFGLLLEVLQTGDALALHHMFQKAHKEGRDYSDEYARFATRWGQIDGAGALQHYFTNGEIPSPADVHNVLKGWAMHRPEDAMAWAVSNRSMLSDKVHPFLGMQDDPVCAVLRGWARKDPAGATAALNAHYSSQEDRMAPLKMLYVENLFGQGLDATMNWLKELPESRMPESPVGRELFRETMQRLFDANATPEQVRESYFRMADQPWAGLAQLDQMAMQFRRRGHDMIAELGSPSTLPMMQEKFTAWSASDPGSVGDWLNQNKGTALYDAGAASLARALKASDPNAAAVWAGTIQDPALRAKAGL